MRQCPNGHAVNDDVKYCPTCGAEIIGRNKFCTKCGSVRKGTEKYCSQCGTPFDIVPTNERIIFKEETDNTFKKYLPYILGVIIALFAIGYFAFTKGLGESHSQTEVVATVVTDGKNSSVIADYDDSKVYSGEYVFDAVLTDATLEKSNTTMTMIIDGDNVSFPTDEFTMKGDIDNELKIEAHYDYGDDLHFVSMSLKPNDKEGKEWVGEYQPTGLLYNVVLKLKEIKHKGEAVKVTEERKADNDSETIADDNSDDSSTTYSSSTTTSSSSRTFYSEQIVIGYLANQTFRASDGLTMRVDGDGRLYVDGDYAGVLSVLRYNATSALLRYGGGMYGEGKLTVQIVGDKFQLKDPTDGTVYYQR